VERILRQLQDEQTITPEQQEVVSQLKSNQCSIVKAASRLFPTLGMKSHATLAIAGLILIRDGIATVDSITEAKQQLVDSTVSSYNREDLPDITPQEVKREVDRLMNREILERRPSETIFRFNKSKK